MPLTNRTVHPPLGHFVREVEGQGFALVPGVFTPAQVKAMVDGLATALYHPNGQGAIGTPGGGVYAARNVLRLWPEAAAVWRQPPLPEVLPLILGETYGLVRALFFDKPPGQTWALPWHKDMTVAVRDNRLVSNRFTKPTRKAGVPHVEAPCEVLEAMLTARIHLDEITAENGPLKVIPGSHRSGKRLVTETTRPRTILGHAGDVFLMRPLVVHASMRSAPGTKRHRRILHLEFCAFATLPDGFEWHDFIPA